MFAVDGPVAEFVEIFRPSVIDAVKWAVEIQAKVAELSAEEPDEQPIEYRVGVNLGDVIVDGDDIFGDGVNVAARLQEIAEPGGVCISEKVQVEVNDKLGVAFADGGAQTMKNITDPIQVWRWSPGQAAAPSTAARVDVGGRLALPDKPSIAVLPFDNLSRDPEQEYFADGMTEEIITALSRIDSIFVIARNSSFTFKGRSVDVRDVARELGVRYVLEGSVRRAENKVRITSQLIDAESATHLWADRFDGDLENIFDLQDRIAESVVGIVEPTLREAEIVRSQRKGPKNLDAYDFLLRSMPNAFAMKQDENALAISLLDKAIDLDPELAPALALKSLCVQQSLSHGWQSQTDEDRAVAVDLARRAIAVGQNQASAMATAGLVLVVSAHDFGAGIAAVRRALELNPNSAYVCMHAGHCLAADGATEEAIDCLERSKLLSPLDPLTYRFHTGMAMAHLMARRPREAYDWASRSQAENAHWIITQRVVASACGHLDKLDDSRAAIARLRELDPRTTLAMTASWFPARDKAALDYFLDGLRKAGLFE